MQLFCKKPFRFCHDDTEDSLSARILEQEHQAYPEAIQLFAQGKLELCGRIVKVKGE